MLVTIGLDIGRLLATWKIDVQFYQYDRIEMLNPGGLYGKANPSNFPRVNDYRNLVVAEGMKVLGFVNRFSRGVGCYSVDVLIK